MITSCKRVITFVFSASEDPNRHVYTILQKQWKSSKINKSIVSCNIRVWWYMVVISVFSVLENLSRHVFNNSFVKLWKIDEISNSIIPSEMVVVIV